MNAQIAPNHHIARIQPDGTKTFFAGHHGNGQVNWVDKAQDALPYPTAFAANNVLSTLEPDKDLNDHYTVVDRDGN